ncbi:MAG TPA: selenocysteine-specific translation elongation factor [Terriglobales bacterium]|nr:selenocysteine-specific translation elongation factor [Terriglobales bacterium]
MKSVIVGTAGHIDHGKTALVKALTGIDADRLEEEKRRGITIDIGFANLELPMPGGETLRLGFVDVPGHERFVRNMLAGVGGIDLVLLVIAADESIKPQTREHFDICRLLSVRRGITVLTKSDAVDPETLAVVRAEVEDFLRESFLGHSSLGHPNPIVALSSLTGAGIDDLKRELVRVAAEVPAKDSNAIARLPIDRVFTMKGFGTVVTGTLISGAIRKEDELEVFPSGRRVRVRGVQVHGKSAEQAVAGQRTALNLAGATTEELARGMALSPPSTFRATSRVDAEVSLLPSAKPLKDRARVHFHSYTAETIAGVVLYGKRQVGPGESSFAQLRLSEPTLLLPGDRFIMRQFSPVVTIGGGVVVENAPPKRVKNATDYARFLKTLSEDSRGGTLRARVTASGSRGLGIAEAVARTGWRAQQIISVALADPEIVRTGDIFILKPALDLVRKGLISALDAFHKRNPLVAGMSKEELRGGFSEIAPEVFDSVLTEAVRSGKIELAGELVRLPGRGVMMKDEEAESKKIIEAAFANAGLKVPALKDVLAGLKVDKARAQKIVTLLLRDKVLVKISDDLVFHRDALLELRKRMAAEKAKSPKLDVARFKDLTGVTRKYAIPLLEYLDREHVTRRVGDDRVIL